MRIRTTLIATVGITGLLLWGCEGGGITGTGADPKPVSVGVITGFGSVHVNGVKFKTSTDSKFTLDDINGAETDLKVGMIVSIVGSINADGSTGTADHITYADEVEGVVISNDIATTNSLDIMGQTIHVDINTTFESRIAGVLTVDQVQVGNIVEVSGYNSGDGNIYATRVEVKKEKVDAGDELELSGTIANLNTSTLTFTIGSQTISYSGAEYDDIPGNVLSNGLLVEVKSKQGIVANQFVAEKVKRVGDGVKKYELEKGQDIELEGIVSHYDSTTNSFTVNGQAVMLDASLSTAISNGVKISVHGVINSDNVLIANEAEVHAEANLQISAYIQTFSTSENTLTIMGKTVKVNDLTYFYDEADRNGEPLRSLSLGNMNIGDYLEIAASYDANSGVLTATRIKRENPEDNAQVAIQGEVSEVISDINVSSITVAGIIIDISGLPELTPIVGDRVEVQGTWNGQVISAVEGSIDDSIYSEPEEKAHREDDEDNY